MEGGQRAAPAVERQIGGFGEESARADVMKDIGEGGVVEKIVSADAGDDCIGTGGGGVFDLAVGESFKRGGPGHIDGPGEAAVEIPVLGGSDRREIPGLQAGMGDRVSFEDGFDPLAFIRFRLPIEVGVGMDRADGGAVGTEGDGAGEEGGGIEPAAQFELDGCIGGEGAEEGPVEEIAK